MEHRKLIDKLKSPHPGDVVTALEEIEQGGSMHDLSLTISLIRNTNHQIRQAAVKATVTIIRESIIKNYHTLGVEGRQKLARIIDKIHPETIQELVRDINSANEEQRIHGLMILGLIRRRPNIRRVLETQLKSNNEKIRATAIQALGNYPDSGELLTVMQQLNDNDERVRANAIEALEQFGDPKLVFSIKRLVNDGNNRVRANALKALFNLGDQNIDNDVIQMLHSNDLMMIASGLWLIAELGLYTPQIYEKCKEFINHIDNIVKKNAERAMERYRLDGRINEDETEQSKEASASPQKQKATVPVE